MALDIVLLKGKKMFNSWDELTEQDIPVFKKSEIKHKLQGYYSDLQVENNNRYILADLGIEIFIGDAEKTTAIILNIHMPNNNKTNVISEITELLECRAYTFEGEEVTPQYISKYNEWINNNCEKNQK